MAQDWMVGRQIRPGTVQFDQLVESVIWQESRGDPNAVSSAGAAGLMQVMPETAADPGFGVRPMDWSQRFNPQESRRFGTQYLAAMLERYGGDTERALVAYNYGPGAADNWNGQRGSLPRETQGYLRNIMGQSSAPPSVGVGATSQNQRGSGTGGGQNAAPFDWDGRRWGGATREDGISGLEPGFRSGLESLISSAPEEFRGGLGLGSGYRSVERQQQLWDAALIRYGSEAEARKWVAPPGRSMHNSGQAGDLYYNGQRIDRAPQEVQDWVHQNAASHNLHFPMSWEPWHIEPLGTRGTTPNAAAAAGQGASNSSAFSSPNPADTRATQFANNMAILAQRRERANNTPFSRPGMRISNGTQSAASNFAPIRGITLGNLFEG